MRWFLDSSRVVGSSTDMAGDTGRHPASGASSDASERSISQMADDFGVTMRTLRFYESKGLIRPRRIGNRRFYGEECQARLRLVLKGKAMGLGLDEIAELVDLVESDLTDAERARKVRALCERQRETLMARRDLIDEQIEETARVIDGLTSI